MPPLAAVFRDYREQYPEATRRSKAMGMYRQNYCGCMFSKIEAAEEREARKAERAAAKAAEEAAEAPARAAAEAARQKKRAEKEKLDQIEGHRVRPLRRIRGAAAP